MAKHRRGLAEKALATRVRVDATTGCHIWTGSFINSGYGRLKSGDEVLAHRVAYTLARGPIPAGTYIDPKGARRCRACSAENWARHAAAVNANRRAKAKARSAPDEPSSSNHNEESQTNGS